MNKNSKTVAIAAIAAILIVILAFVVRDLLFPHQKIVNCSDGSHPTIDIRDFTTQYWAYSVKLEASVEGKTQVSTELDPKMLAQISQGLQEARDFRKYVVAGYTHALLTKPNMRASGRSSTC